MVAGSIIDGFHAGSKVIVTSTESMPATPDALRIAPSLRKPEAGQPRVVAVIVKMDDVGLRLKQTASRIRQYVGRGLVAAMPALLSVLSNVGMVAMLWVDGHILLAGSDHLGWHPPYQAVHQAADRVRHSVKAFGAVAAWLIETGVASVVGLAVGAVAVAVVALLSLVRRRLWGLANRAGTDKM